MDLAKKEEGLLRRFLKGVGQFQSGLLLSLLYLILWLPVGLVTRLFADWLRRRAPQQSAWRPRDPRVNDPAHLREPF